MIPIRRIVCPVDFSEFSLHALSVARALARWYEASITVVHVFTTVPMTASEAPIPPQALALTAEQRDRLIHDLRRFTGPEQSGGVNIRVVLLEGDPVGALVNQARDEQASLIVIGTHGRSGFKRLLLGSVAEQLLREACCPVLTVPRRAEGVPAGNAAPFRKILCPIDFSDSSLRALEWAFALAREARARVTLLHSTESFVLEGSVESPAFDLPELQGALERRARGRLEALVPAGARTSSQPDIVVSNGKAWRDILMVAAERDSNLIVMGVAGRGIVNRLMFGSTTEHVVREATCPVLTLRTA